MSDNATGYWAIAYHANSNSPRARKWYYVARVARVDGKWWALGRYDGISGNSRADVIKAAIDSGLDLKRGLFEPAPSPRAAGEQVVWSLER
jgi:hypothetical protein